MITEKRKVIDKSIIQNLVTKTNLSEIVVELLCMRGFDTEDKISSFFLSNKDNLLSPYAIKDMQQAVDFINNAVDNKKRILIYGDYDCDGITSIATLKKYFDYIGYDVDYYLPDRELEGYGLSEVCINNFMSMYKPEVVITVDCGVSNRSEIELLKKIYNVEVLVTDHHEIGDDLPDCIVINPKTSDNKLVNLAGVGVVFKLVEALAGRTFAMNLLDIVSIGTIADLVELTGENRIIVKLGLELLNENHIKGIQVLKNQIKKYGNLTEGDIGFSIAPMINSIGRMANANNVVDIFLTEDNFYLQSMAIKLEKLNNERKFLCDVIFDDAIKMLKNYDFETNKVIALYSEHWKPGILGIVASRIAEEYNLPTILFGNGNDCIKGSARSAGGVDLYKMLSSAKEYFISFGGHSGAAGLSIHKANLSKILEVLNQYIVDNNLIKNLYPKIIYDIEIDSITKELYKDIATLQPFGMGNPTPKFLIKNNGGFTCFAKKHIKAERNGYELVAFNELDNLANFNNSSNMLVKLGENTFNGVTKYQGIVEKNCLVGKAYENEDYILDYYKNLLYKSKDLSVKYISDYSEFLNNCDDIFGTLFVTFSPKTYNTLINVILKLPKYKNKFFMYDIKNRSTLPPYNRVVLSPNRNFDFTGYKNIVFVETPINLVYHNNINNVFIIDNNIPFRDEIKGCRLTREFLGEIYQTLRLAVNKKEVATSVEEWYFLLTNSYGLECSLLEFSLAFYIFYELGFFLIAPNFKLCLTTVKKPLDMSKIFNEIMRVKDVWG